MEAVCLFETLVTAYKAILCHNLVDYNTNSQGRENKSRTMEIINAIFYEVSRR
jgi:hypothetical protein